MSQRFAVIGNPVAHSLSPHIHQYFAEQFNIQLTYEKILSQAPDFAAQVSYFFSQGGKGLNVTLPFKEEAFALAQIKTPRGQLAGAVNTLWMHAGQLHADNTDGIGFLRDLVRHIEPQGKQILLLGAGGAARGILGPLSEAQPAKLVLANRTLANAEALKHWFPQVICVDLNHIQGEFDLIINASSASLQKQSLALPDSCWLKHPFCYDLAYNALEDTVFVAEAKQQGCGAIDGLGMLVEQAAEAFFIWHGRMPQTLPVLNQLRGLN